MVPHLARYLVNQRVPSHQEHKESLCHMVLKPFPHRSLDLSKSDLVCKSNRLSHMYCDMWSRRESRRTSRCHDQLVRMTLKTPKCTPRRSRLFLCSSLSLSLGLWSGLAFWPFAGRLRISRVFSQALLAKSFKISDHRPSQEI